MACLTTDWLPLTKPPTRGHRRATASREHQLYSAAVELGPRPVPEPLPNGPVGRPPPDGVSPFTGGQLSRRSPSSAGCGCGMFGLGRNAPSGLSENQVSPEPERVADPSRAGPLPEPRPDASPPSGPVHRVGGRRGLWVVDMPLSFLGSASCPPCRSGSVRSHGSWGMGPTARCTSGSSGGSVSFWPMS